jgi:hypothetical protein
LAASKFPIELLQGTREVKNLITAAVINCPGRWGDDSYHALEIHVEGVNTPFHCVLALPVVACKALSGKVDASALYEALAEAINTAQARVTVTTNARLTDIIAA